LPNLPQYFWLTLRVSLTWFMFDCVANPSSWFDPLGLQSLFYWWIFVKFWPEKYDFNLYKKIFFITKKMLKMSKILNLNTTFCTRLHFDVFFIIISFRSRASLNTYITCPWKAVHLVKLQHSCSSHELGLTPISRWVGLILVANFPSGRSRLPSLDFTHSHKPHRCQRVKVWRKGPGACSVGLSTLSPWTRLPNSQEYRKILFFFLPSYVLK
jgi:hypothetical protein